MSWLIIWALWTLCWTTTGLDYQPSYRPEKNIIRLEKTIDMAHKGLNRKDTEITETVYSNRYAWAYGIKFNSGYYQDTFFVAIDYVSMSYVRLWKSSLRCK